MSLDDLLADLDRQSSAKKNGDDGKTRWLGRVKLLAIEGQQDQEYATTVAVWTDSRKGFDKLLQTKIASRHLKLLSCESAMPAVKWLYHYPNDYAALELAQGVFKTWPIAFGQFVKMEPVVNESAKPEAYLTMTELNNIEPLDKQFGIWPLKTVPDALYAPLFGQPEASEEEYNSDVTLESVPPLNTYAIVDGAKIIYLETELESSGLPWRCLFKENVDEQLKASAPYLVQLEDGNRFTRRLFTRDDTPWSLWDKNAALFIRSRASLSDLWQHFRKFVYCQDDETGKWVYFRFYESGVCRDYLTAINDWDERVCKLFALKKHTPITQILCLNPEEGSAYMAEPKQQLLAPKLDTLSDRAFCLTKRDRIEFRSQQKQKNLRKMCQHLRQFFPDITAQIGDQPLLDQVTHAVDRMQAKGFQNSGHLFLLAAWQVVYGADFELNDQENQLRYILDSKANEQQRIDALKSRMAALNLPRISPSPQHQGTPL